MSPAGCHSRPGFHQHLLEPVRHHTHQADSATVTAPTAPCPPRAAPHLLMSLMDLKASSMSPMVRKKLKLIMASRVGLSQSSSPTKSRRGLLPTAWGMHWDPESSWSSRLASPGWMTKGAVYLWVPVKPVHAPGLSPGDPLHRPHI